MRVSTPRSRLLNSCAATAITAGLLAVTACSGPAGAPAGPPDIADNCGVPVSVEGPPQRAVSLNQQQTEIMLSLGLEDRMVGTATWTDPVAPHLAEANATVPRLADNNPSLEAVLGTEPDLVLGGYQAIYTDGGVAPRERFAEFGVPTYLSPSNCYPEAAELGEPVELGDIYREVHEIAQLFEVPERGEKLVADLRGRVEAAQAKVAGLEGRQDISVLFWFARTGSPYVAGSTGAPGIITRALGVRNAYPDVDSMWPQVGWEDVLRRAPDLLVLGDLTRDSEGDTLEAKQRFLRTDPAVSQLDAVRAERWMPMTGSAMNVSIRTVDGIEALADRLVELDQQA